MKKNYGIYVLLIFCLFVPKVYAFNYEMNTSVDNASVKKGDVKDIVVSLSSVSGTSSGIMACSLDIQMDEGITLNSNVKVFANWNVTHGEIYLFDTGNPVVSSSRIFTIPVKVNNNGSVKLIDIKCSDGETNATVSDKTINFTLSQSNSNANNNNNASNNNTNSEDAEDNNNDDTNVSSVNIKSIQLSDGSIEFDPEITEYNITVSDFSSLEVNVELESDGSQYIIDKNFGDEKNIVITVTANDGNSKIYTINVLEDSSLNNNNMEEKNNYVPIFVVIICFLVIINIIRIVIKLKK